MFFVKKKDEPVRDLKTRHKSHHAIILEMFKNGDEVSTTTLRRFSANHTARISELREEGHVIVRNYRDHGVYDYVYLGQKED